MESEESKSAVSSNKTIIENSTAASSTINIKKYTLNEAQPWTIDLIRGKIIKIDATNAVSPMEFRPHKCCPDCVRWTKQDAPKALSVGPLAVPLYFGFTRTLKCFRRRTIFYTTPCGRRLRTMKGLHRYLRITKSWLTIDMFNVDVWVKCFNEFVIEKANVIIPDVTNGKEVQSISCVNCIDDEIPSFPGYMTERVAKNGVPLNLDSEFLCGCDCTDDCQDKEKCSCWQLTIQEQNLIPNQFVDVNVGYNYRRLYSPVSTGIYECNSRCKCSKTTCLNRVVQQPTSQKLQLFKTENKGWGIRCLNDISQGAFICIYVGRLMTDKEADEEGKRFGDEYFAELDYIEVIQKLKAGYEIAPPAHLMKFTNLTPKDITDILNESGDDSSTDTDGDFVSNMISTNALYEWFENKKNPNDLINGHANIANKNTSVNGKCGPNNKYKVSLRNSIRNYYGQTKEVYIMDARQNGNIGRYLNHSCCPNVFVQNVFVDTHDLRFPWIAFFARMYIRAGSELSWDYNYDVGSVKNTVKYCHCGSPNCRGRLL